VKYTQTHTLYKRKKEIIPNLFFFKVDMREKICSSGGFKLFKKVYKESESL